MIDFLQMSILEDRESKNRAKKFMILFDFVLHVNQTQSSLIDSVNLTILWKMKMNDGIKVD